jgi:hypothetical protein
MAKQKAMDLKSAIKLILDSEEESVPAEVYENPELYLALIKPEADYFGMAWLVGNRMPASLRQDRGLMEQLVRHTPKVFGELGSPLNDDLELFNIAIEDDLKVFENAGPGIKANKKIVKDFFKRWIAENPYSLEPITWISESLVKELKLVESAGFKSFPAKDGYNRFVIEISQWGVPEKKAHTVLEKHISFLETLIEDKNAELFEEVFQGDNSEEEESVDTTAFLYIKDMTLKDMDDYLNNLAGKKVKAATVLVHDIDTPEYMNYFDGEVDSGSIDSDSSDDDLYYYIIKGPNLSRWPIKVLDAYL